MTTGWRYVSKQLLFLLIIALLACVFLAAGLIIGYAVIGGGDNALSILSVDKWQSIIGKFTGK